MDGEAFAWILARCPCDDFEGGWEINCRRIIDICVINGQYSVRTENVSAALLNEFPGQVIYDAFLVSQRLGSLAPWQAHNLTCLAMGELFDGGEVRLGAEA